jgi:hypothetical protein
MATFRCSIFAVFFLSIVSSGCIPHAAPTLFIPFGAPHTAPESGSILGVGLGSGAVLFTEGHGGGHGWLGRWRYGLTSSMDLGLDVIGVQRSDRGALGGKLGSRWKFHDALCFDAGIGVTDDSKGKSVAGSIGIIIGTPDEHRRWGYYGGLSVTRAIAVTNKDDYPNSWYFMGSAGAIARPTDWFQVIVEGGAGAVVIPEFDPGMALYIGMGIAVNINPED